MPESRQLDILKRLTAHLQGITPANGYDFDLSQSVFRGRLIFGDDDPSPLVSIVEHLTADVNVSTTEENQVLRFETWVLLVQGWILYDVAHPTDDAYQLKASVEKRLGECIKQNDQGYPAFPDAYFLGYKKGITGMSIGPGVVSVAIRQEASSRAFFYLPLGIGLATDVSNPFLP
jgi:hypothetical protein